MMGLFHLSNLEKLHIDMRNKKVTRTVFPFEMNNNGTSCMFKYFCIPYNPNANERFTPAALFRMLDTQIPVVHNNQPDYHHVLRISGKYREVEDSEKIFICGWRTNPSNAIVTNKNFEKTRLAFGEKTASAARTANVSSRWTDIKDEEILLELNRFG